MEQGLSYYKAEQYADAIAAFDRLIQLTPDYAGAYFNKGNALIGMGRYEEAVAAYDQAIRLAPNVADAYTAKGRALESLGRADEAQKTYADGRMYGY
jgi:tetratricopeptide (TPR) repeat protein